MGKIKGISLEAGCSSSLYSVNAVRPSSGLFRAKKGMVMRCPFLDCSKLCCTVGSGAYVPNHIELQRFCKKPEHKRCRFYIDLCVWSFLNSDLF